MDNKPKPTKKRTKKVHESEEVRKEINKQEELELVNKQNESNNDHEFYLIAPEEGKNEDKNEDKNKLDIEKQLNILNKLDENVLIVKNTDGNKKKKKKHNKDDESNHSIENFVKQEVEMTEEDKVEKMRYVEKYKQYRANFKFVREPINPNKLTIDELKYEIDLLQNELNSKGSMIAFQALLMTSVSALEHSSKLFNIGLKLDGLTKSIEDNKKEFEQVMKEIQIKYSLFAPGPEMRFIMLLAKSIYITHQMNVALENRKNKENNIDPKVLNDLKEKFKSI